MYGALKNEHTTNGRLHVNLRFQGQSEDRETGLYDNFNRYYDPQAGRYINHDPIGLMGGLNQYQYCPNPVEWVDPLGLICKEAFKNIKGTTYTGRMHRMEKPEQTETTWTAGSWNVDAEHRYSGRGLGAVYGGTTKRTAMAEVEHYDITSGYKTAQRKYKYKDVEINNMLDLTNPDVRNQLGISLDELTATGQGSYKLTN